MNIIELAGVSKKYKMYRAPGQRLENCCSSTSASTIANTGPYATFR